MANLTNTITRHIATLYTESSGWALEFNEVAWNKGAPRLELRKWSPDHSRCEKGVTLSQDTLKLLIPLMENEVIRDGE